MRHRFIALVAFVLLLPVAIAFNDLLILGLPATIPFAVDLAEGRLR